MTWGVIGDDTVTWLIWLKVSWNDTGKVSWADTVTRGKESSDATVSWGRVWGDIVTGGNVSWEGTENI